MTWGNWGNWEKPTAPINRIILFGNKAIYNQSIIFWITSCKALTTSVLSLSLSALRIEPNATRPIPAYKGTKLLRGADFNRFRSEFLAQKRHLGQMNPTQESELLLSMLSDELQDLVLGLQNGQEIPSSEKIMEFLVKAFKDQNSKHTTSDWQVRFRSLNQTPGQSFMQFILEVNKAWRQYQESLPDSMTNKD